MEGLISNFIPVRGIFNLNFLFLNVFLILSILIGFLIGRKKKININIGLSLLIVTVFVLVSFNFQFYGLYYIIFYMCTSLFIGYTIGIFFNKKIRTIKKIDKDIIGSSQTIPTETQSKTKYSIILLIGILLFFVCMVIIINHGNFSFIIHADSRIHISKILKFSFGEANLSPIFLEGYHHYPQFSYFLVKYLITFFDIKNVIQFYGIFSLFFSLITYVLYFILIKNFTKNHLVATLSLITFISLAVGFLPSFYIIFLEILFFLILFKKMKNNDVGIGSSLLLINIIVGISLSHYLGSIEIATFILFFVAIQLFYRFGRKYFNSIRDFFVSIYDKSNNLGKINIIYIILLLLLSIYIYDKIGASTTYITYSEIGLNLSSLIAFLVVGLSLPTIGLILKKFQNNKNIIIFFISIILWFSNIFFYYSNNFILHGRYFPEKAILFVILPFGLLFFLSLIKKNNNKLIIFSCLVLFIFSNFYVQFNYLDGYVNSSNTYRYRLISELLPYKKSLEKTVLFLNPYSMLNRYVTVDIDSYIYSVNYKDTSKTIPFTTIPNKIDSYSFSNPGEKFDLAIQFIASPDPETYKNLFKFHIDYFILEKGADKKLIEFFTNYYNNLNIIYTDNYVIVKLNN